MCSHPNLRTALLVAGGADGAGHPVVLVPVPTVCDSLQCWRWRLFLWRPCLCGLLWKLQVCPSVRRSTSVSVCLGQAVLCRACFFTCRARDLAPLLRLQVVDPLILGVCCGPRAGALHRTEPCQVIRCALARGYCCGLSEACGIPAWKSEGIHGPASFNSLHRVASMCRLCAHALP